MGILEKLPRIGDLDNLNHGKGGMGTGYHPVRSDHIFRMKTFNGRFSMGFGVCAKY